MSPHAKLYKTKQWLWLRRNQLCKDPLCAMCGVMGRKVAAKVVDHIKPHRGDLVLFYDADNLQSLCVRCHVKFKQLLETTGKLIGSNADGMPLDPNHHWNL